MKTLLPGCILVLSFCHVQAQPSVPLTWLNPVNDTNASFHLVNLTAVAESGSNIVAVGYQPYASTILFSPNGGVSWQENQNPPQFLDITYGNGTFVAVGVEGEIWNSTNPAVTWSDSSIPPFESINLNRVIYADGVFAIVSTIGGFFSSSDGTGWTAYPPGTSESLNGLAYGNGMFILVGNEGAIFSGQSEGPWTSVTSGVTNSLVNVAYGDGQFVAVGQSGVILSSPNGTNWTTQNSGVTADFANVVFEGGIFAALTSSSSGNLLLISADGSHWYPMSLATAPYQFNNLAATPSGFLFVGEGADIAESGALPRPLIPLGVVSNGFQLSFYGISNQACTLQRSGDLINWTNVMGFTNTQSPTILIDTSSSQYQYQFYRVVSM